MQAASASRVNVPRSQDELGEMMWMLETAGPLDSSLTLSWDGSTRVRVKLLTPMLVCENSSPLSRSAFWKASERDLSAV